MKLCVLVFATLLFVFVLNATDIDYDISHFKPTDLLDYSLIMGYSNSAGYSIPLADYKSSYLANALGFNGNIIKEKKDYKLSISSYFYPSHSIRNSQYPNGDQSNKETRTYARLHWENDITYKRYWDKLFTEFGVSEEYDYATDKARYEHPLSVDKFTIREYELWSTYSISIGLGRLYESQEAYLAWYIFKELDKNECLKPDYTSASIDSLASVLYKLRSVHVIDPYQKTRAKMTALIDYLKSTGYVDSSKESRAIAILIQLWQVNGNQRLTGAEIAITPSSSTYNTKRTRNSNNDDYHDSATSYYGTHNVTLSFRYEKPIHTIFQLQHQTTLSQLWDDYTGHSDSDSSSYHWLPYTRFYTTSSFTWYPDFRSSATFRLNGGYQYKNIMDYIIVGNTENTKSSGLRGKDRVLDCTAQLAYSRFLTERTSCNARLTGNYEWQRVEQAPLKQEKSIGFDFIINYSLF